MRQAAKEPGLAELLGKMKEARAKIHSLNETMQQVYTQVLPQAMGESYKSTWLAMKWREPLCFAMDISRAMNCVFKMGNDGTTAWLERSTGIKTCPISEIDDKWLEVCDPFHSTTDAPAAAIRNLNLEYLGTGEWNGKRCHFVQRWHVDVTDFGKEKNVYGTRVLWFIDAESFLPVQTVTDSSITGSRTTMTFAYDHVNGDFPAETFSPPAPAGIPSIPAPPLDNDYVKRFFYADDGGSGKIVCRWGRQGPKGQYSSGMN